MKARDIERILAVLVLPVLIFAGAASPLKVHANGNIPVTIDIPLTYIVNGNESAAGGDRFVLTPDDPAAPMPEDASGGRKTIDVRGEGTYSFGMICYDRPEIWWYTITREITEKKGVTKDDSVYKAKVIALNDGHGYVLVYKKGSDDKSELVYTDRTAPETGDTAPLIYAAIACAAATALTAMMLFRKRRRDR